MTSIRDQLENKQRRRAVVPVLVSDHSEDVATLNGIMVAFHAAREAGDSDTAASLQSQIDEATERIQAHWAQVELQSLPPAEWEAAVSAWQTIELQDDGPVAVMNWTEGLPALLAVSCVDPDLQDAAWWTTQLTSERWSEGDVDALKYAVLSLNIDAAEPRAPKG